MLDSKVSDATPIKHADFDAIVRAQMRASKAILARHAYLDPFYYYIDLNAGSGSPGGIDGSPLLFMRIARELDVPYRAWFMERDPAEYDRLVANVEQERLKGVPFGSRVYPEFGDHNRTIGSVITAILNGVRRGSGVIGLAYTDPYGLDGLAIQPLAALAALKQFKQLDMLLHANSIIYKRVRTAFDRDCYLSSDLASITHGSDGAIRKSCVWIQEPYGKQQWTTYILSNWYDFPRFTKRMIHPIDSAAGIEIERRLNLTESEREALANMPLPF